MARTVSGCCPLATARVGPVGRKHQADKSVCPDSLRPTPVDERPWTELDKVRKTDRLGWEPCWHTTCWFVRTKRTLTLSEKEGWTNTRCPSPEQSFLVEKNALPSFHPLTCGLVHVSWQNPHSHGMRQWSKRVWFDQRTDELVNPRSDRVLDMKRCLQPSGQLQQLIRTTRFWAWKTWNPSTLKLHHMMFANRLVSVEMISELLKITIIRVLHWFSPMQRVDFRSTRAPTISQQSCFPDARQALIDHLSLWHISGRTTVTKHQRASRGKQIAGQRDMFWCSLHHCWSSREVQWWQLCTERPLSCWQCVEEGTMVDWWNWNVGPDHPVPERPHPESLVPKGVVSPLPDKCVSTQTCRRWRYSISAGGDARSLDPWPNRISICVLTKDLCACSWLPAETLQWWLFHCLCRTPKFYASMHPSGGCATHAIDACARSAVTLSDKTWTLCLAHASGRTKREQDGSKFICVDVLIAPLPRCFELCVR